jgi:hypothetical protein
MITPEILQTIKQHKQESKIAVLKDFCTDTPSWQEFIDYIDKSSHQESYDEPNDYDKALGAVLVGNVMIKQNFYFYLRIHAHMNETTKQIDQAFSDAFRAQGGISSVYVNFSSNLSNIPQHFDRHDNFYWQCIGSTTWHCDDKTYTVNPGDMVYIPSNTYHGVDFSMPRAAIGFSWFLD